jgi:hypothetical protein
MKEDKILYSGWGGIGDVLQFSSLPRRFTELGHAVYLSSKTPFRNPEIKELTINLNPYIVGVSDAEPNCGNPVYGIIYQDVCGNFIMNWEVAHGLTPETMYPELYYPPQLVNSISDRILLDVTATSAAPQNIYDAEKLRSFIQNTYDRDKITVCCFHDGIANPLLLLDGYDMVFVENIFHYCCLIHSCKKFVSLHSGGMVLASALKKYGDIDADCIITHSPFHKLALLKHHHFYDNINYIFMPC